MKKNLSKISILSLYVIFFLISCSDVIDKENKAYTIGTIESISYGKRNYAKVSFQTNSGKKMLGHASGTIRDLHEGEMYWVAYDKNEINPDRVVIYYTAPFIKDTLDYIEGRAYIYTKAKREKYVGCNFSYHYNGKKFHKYQRLLDKSIKKGDTVEILINRKRPSIAYVKGNNAITD